MVFNSLRQARCQGQNAAERCGGDVRRDAAWRKPPKAATLRESAPGRRLERIGSQVGRILVMLGLVVLARGPALAQEQDVPGLPPITVRPSGFEAESTGSHRVDMLLARRLRQTEQFRAICRGCARGEAPRPDEMFYPFQTLGEARMR
jgi:hypothetical protein